jgi:hypothetical protein
MAYILRFPFFWPWLANVILRTGQWDPEVGLRDLPSNDAAWEGYCLVQWIDAARYNQTGDWIRLTLQAGDSGAYIDNVSISQASPYPFLPYASVADTLRLAYLPDKPLHIGPNSVAEVLVSGRGIDFGQPVLVAVDFSANPPSSVSYLKWIIDPQYPDNIPFRGYYKLGAEAKIANRTDFVESAYGPVLFLIKAMEFKTGLF